jgi:hypothetical protein
MSKTSKGNTSLFNAANVRQMGLNSEAEALGKTVFDFFPPEIARLYEADDKRVHHVPDYHGSRRTDSRS